MLKKKISLHHAIKKKKKKKLVPEIYSHQH